MSNEVIRSVYTTVCKDCGKPLAFNQEALRNEQLLNKSPPSRCKKCRSARHAITRLLPFGFARDLQSWDDSPVDWQNAANHFMRQSESLLPLFRSDREPRPIVEHRYSGVMREEELKKFSKIIPYVDQVVAEMCNPQGKRVSILVVPPGWGKSTMLPYRLLCSSVSQRGKILLTQPRTVTLRAGENGDLISTVAGYISMVLLGAPGVGPGQEVQLLYRGESELHDRYAKLLVATDGICLRFLQTGDIRNYSAIILDEAHEESTNMVRIMAWAREKLSRYPHLRFIIASATIDPTRFVQYFGGPDNVQLVMAEDNAPPLHPIYDRWPEGEDGYMSLLNSQFTLPQTPKDTPEAVVQLVEAVLTKEGFSRLPQGSGDMVVFFPTKQLIDDTLSLFRRARWKDLVVPLRCHSLMSEEDETLFQKNLRDAREGRTRSKTNPTFPVRP